MAGLDGVSTTSSGRPIGKERAALSKKADGNSTFCCVSLWCRWGRYYYRFHKLIGKANWRKYTERAPAAKSLRQHVKLLYASPADARLHRPAGGGESSKAV